DMAGNVWEWVKDDWHGSYTGAPANGAAWIDEPRGSYRVLRGGGFFSDAGYLRASHRDFGVPSVVDVFIGARCCRSP
ncbi:MAG: SUMF1/EgtB/PvdO family nonheme iron enzyme, partial [Deltaproteobacteria bacterium]|nr:SUMF1/EgtB/PvdO family nonheme iron enzyme [Deltaproteobacteria bacterium]